MGGVVVRRVMFAGLAASMIPAAAFGQRADSGLLTVCNVSGARPATGTFTFTYSTVASAGGTQTFNIAVGTCASRVFYPQGVSVTVTENVPTGYAVTGIALTPTPGGPGTSSVISSNTPEAGSATVTIGSGQATLHDQLDQRAARAPARCPTSSASLSPPLRPPCAERTARSGSCARSTPTSTTPTRVQPKPASWLCWLPAPPSISRSASDITRDAPQPTDSLPLTLTEHRESAQRRPEPGPRTHLPGSPKPLASPVASRRVEGFGASPLVATVIGLMRPFLKLPRVALSPLGGEADEQREQSVCCQPGNDGDQEPLPPNHSREPSPGSKESRPASSWPGCTGRLL